MGMITKNKEGKQAWNRWLSIVTAGALTVAFWKDAKSDGALDIWVYLTYPAGMLLCYGPVVAADIISSVVLLIEAIAKMKQPGATVETTTSTTAGGDTKTQTTATPPKNTAALEGAL